MKNVLRIALKVAAPVLIILVGLGIRTALVKTKPVPERTDRTVGATLVETQTAVSARHRIVVHAQGSVIPAERVVLQPQVGGRIVWQSEKLVPGTRVEAGEVLVRVDPSDYQVAMEQQAANLNRAELEAELERSRARVAQREWQIFEGASQTATPEDRALALREPQTENARVAVRAAESGIRRARLDLARTQIRAPFDAVIQAEAVDLGQVVSPQSQLATLVGSTRSWVQVSVPLENLSRISVPRANGEEGAVATVAQDVGEGRIVREGRVIRLLGDLDPVGRMARLLVEIEDPYGFARPADAEGSALPLLVGAYVDVEIEGGAEEELIEIPRIALREGQKVWVMGEGDALEIRDVDVAWRREESVLLSGGISTGDRVVTSRIPVPVAGMQLRTADGAPSEAAREARAEAR
jgi:RND family efflux transporter MFP subunit